MKKEEPPLTCFHWAADAMKEAVATTPTANSMKSSVTFRNLELVDKTLVTFQLLAANLLIEWKTTVWTIFIAPIHSLY